MRAVGVEEEFLLLDARDPHAPLAENATGEGRLRVEVEAHHRLGGRGG